MPQTTLRYPGTCARCRRRLPAGARAFFDPADRSITCTDHTRPGHARPGHGRRPRPEHGGSSRPVGAPISARVFADQVAEQSRAATRRRWGPLAPLVAALSGPDPLVRAARKGAAGEERLGALLDRVAARSGGAVRVLHDRRIPGRRENLDHVVVCPSGVWAVDAKAYAGAITTGGWGRRRLRVGGREQDRLIAQGHRQQRFLAEACARLGLPAVATAAALCFVGGELGWPHNGRRVEGVLVCSPRVLRRRLRAEGPLTPAQVAAVADRLEGWFTPQ